MAIKYLSKDRVDLNSSLNRWDIKKLILDENIQTVQFCTPIKLKSLILLNDIFLSVRPDVEFRVYGFYQDECNLSFLKDMKNIRNLSVDSLIDATGLEYITELPDLKSLSVGIFNLDNFDFLNHIAKNVEKIFLGVTRSKKPKLDPLSRFICLKELYLEGQQKNIEVISHLQNLEDLTLRSITLTDLSFLYPLKNLWSLDIKLGGTIKLSDIDKVQNLKYLELWQIRGLSDISFVSNLTHLQYLYLQSLPQIKKLPRFNKLERLRRIYLENMKGLVDVSSLENAPSLEEFVFTHAHNMHPEDFYPLFKNNNIKSAGVWFGSNRKNNKFESLLKEFNLEKYEYYNFEFN